MSESVTDPSVEAEDTAYPVRLAEQCYSVARDVQAKKCSFAGLIGCCRDQLVDSLNRAGNELLRLSQGREAEQREAAAEPQQPDAETLDHVRNEAYKRGLRATKLFEAHKFLKEANGLWEAFNIWRNRARSAEGKLQKALALLGMTEHDLDNPKPASVPPKSDEVAAMVRDLLAIDNDDAHPGVQRIAKNAADLLERLAQQVQELQSRELDTPRGILRGICGCGQVSLAQIHVHDNMLGHKFVPATAEQLASHILTSKEEIRAKHQVIENLEHEVARLKAEAERHVEQIRDKDAAIAATLAIPDEKVYLFDEPGYDIPRACEAVGFNRAVKLFRKALTS
jgi:DNA repair exonuclease SbcCD ATPase subunit